MNQPLTFQGIEITKDNVYFLRRHGVSPYSDLYLTASHTLTTGGFARADGYLLKITGDNREEIRSRLEGEATVMMNTSPGWRYADAVDRIVTRYLADPAGYSWPYEETNRKLMAYDPTGEKAGRASSWDGFTRAAGV
jgi:hypothetical protein